MFSVFLIGLVLKTCAYIEVCYGELIQRSENETALADYSFLHVGFNLSFTTLFTICNIKKDNVCHLDCSNNWALFFRKYILLPI